MQWQSPQAWEAFSENKAVVDPKTTLIFFEETHITA